MCGVAGSGKSTAADRLARDGYTVLSFDREAWRRGYRDHPVPEAARAEVHAALQRRLLALVAAGQPVVVDTAFWSRASRDEYRRLLAPTGVQPVVHYLATDPAEVRRRLAARQGTGPDDILVDEALAARHAAVFEPPTEDEGPLRVVSG